MVHPYPTASPDHEINELVNKRGTLGHADVILQELTRENATLVELEPAHHRPARRCRIKQHWSSVDGSHSVGTA
jgi:hypothetical protein